MELERTEAEMARHDDLRIVSEHRLLHRDRPVRDVLKLTCASCGAVRAAERVGPCAECGSGDVDEVSLNSALADLEPARRQVETLLDGVHRHLETVSGKRGVAVQTKRMAAGTERRIWTRPRGAGG
jgi:hypothetical protein